MERFRRGGRPRRSVAREIGEEGLERPGLGDAGEADAVVEDDDRRVGVAQVLEGEEFCADRLGRRPRRRP